MRRRESAPRVALVHDWLTGMRGGEKVLERIERLFPGAPLYTLFHFPGTVSEAIESHPIRTSFLQGLPAAEKHYRRYLPLFPAAIERFDLSEFDLVVSTSHAVAKGAQAAPNGAHLCYCHTPMRYIWDQEEVYFPDRSGLTARLRGSVLERLRRWDVRTADRVTHYLANSSFVAERIERHYGRESTVLPPPVDTEFYTPDPGVREGAAGYALVVSALAPYKRVDLAIEACRRAGFPLRIVGDGTERETLRALAGPDVTFHGRVPAAELRNLYRGATCFVQPGVEDFGISSVEALACGSPVVALGRGGIRDIVSEPFHGILTGDPQATSADPDELADAIDKVRRMRFNPTDLSKRAEHFSVMNFDARFQAELHAVLASNPHLSPLGDPS